MVLKAIVFNHYTTGILHDLFQAFVFKDFVF